MHQILQTSSLLIISHPIYCLIEDYTRIFTNALCNSRKIPTYMVEQCDMKRFLSNSEHRQSGYPLVVLSMFVVLISGIIQYGSTICDHLSKNPHKHVKQNLKIICEITHATGKYLQGLMGPAISKASFKLYTILLTWLWRVRKSLFRFHSLICEYVTCVCLQCGKHKQNRYHFLGKTATIDKCAVSLRVISIAYLFGQSLVS